jgi:phosphoglycerate dehydrogenase-like enzyme
MKINKLAIIDFGDMRSVKDYHVDSVKKVLPEAEVILAYGAKDLLSKTDDADVIITWSIPPIVNRDFIEFCKGAKSLKWIHSFIAGVDVFMNSEICDMDIIITCTKGIHSFPMADHTLAYIFAFLRAFPVFIRSQLNRKYDTQAESLCDETYEKTVGIIGLGNIGHYIAQKCKLLGMRVVAVKRTPIESEWVDHCYSNEELGLLLKESDFVVVTVPLTKDTQKLIGEKELRMMKKSAYLINIARGGVIDQEALIRVLKENAIAGAGLDVFEEEPLPQDSPLWDIPNVIITPHVAARSPYYMDRAIKVAIDNLQRYTRDEDLLYKIDKEVGY